MMIVLAVAAASLFSSADQAGRVAADSQRLKAIQIAVAETAIHRAAMVIAFASGQSDEQVAVEAIGEAVAAATRIESQLNPLSDADALRDLAREVTDSTEAIQRELGQGRVDIARAEVERTTLPAVSSLAEALSGESAIVSGRIDAEQARAGQIAQAASFAIALLIPILAVAFVRFRAKRRLERARLESEVARQRELAETKDKLIAGLSHLLRTPLTGIYGWADLISRAPDADIVEEGALAILEQSGELRRMVDDILVTARSDAVNLGHRPGPARVGAVVEQAIQHFVRVGAIIKLDCEDQEVVVDRGRLQHVVHNLVSNALHHGEGPVEVIGRLDGEVYRLAICDRGPGLPQARQSDPFASFAHAPEEITTANSLGLGLSVAWSLTDLMGGTIEYRRERERTAFLLAIPKGGAGTG